MNRRTASLRVRLSIGTTVRLAISIAAFGVIAYFASRRAALSAGESRARSAVFSLARNAGPGLLSLQQQLATTAADPAVVAALRAGQPSERAAEALSRLPRDSAQTVAVGLRSLSGRIVLSEFGEFPAGGFDESQRPDRVHFGRLVARGDRVFYEVVAPVFDGLTLLGSVVRVRTLPKTSSAPSTVSELLGFGGALLFGNADGTLWTDLTKVVAGPPRPDSSGGQPGVLVATRELTGTPFVFAVTMLEAPVLAPVRRLAWTFALIGAAIVLLGLLGSWWSLGRVVHPLTELARAAEAMTKRHRPESPPAAGTGDELGRLQDAFRTMEHAVQSQHEQLQEEIRERERSEEALLDASRRKDVFLATLAHELRNPLAPIRNVAEVMRIQASGNPDLNRAQEVITRQVAQMSRLLDELLDVSRVTHGRLELRLERVELATVVATAVEVGRIWVDAAGHELRVHLPTEPIFVTADPVRLAQIITNLLHNAAKYTPPGGRIALAAEREGDDVVISVTDNGLGLSADTLASIFEPFVKVRSADEATLHPFGGGLGIGLSLVRGLVDLHGGRAEVASAGIGQGSRFSVRLPAAAPAVAVSPAPEGTDPSGTRRRLLIADDLADGAESLAELLRLMGHDVITATGGAEAVAMAERARPDFLLLDLGMPVVDGYEACRRIRAEPWGRAMVVIAVTGWGQEQDRSRTKEAGFDFHLTKPVDPPVLLALLSTTIPGATVTS